MTATQKSLKLVYGPKDDNFVTLKIDGTATIKEVKEKYLKKYLSAYETEFPGHTRTITIHNLFLYFNAELLYDDDNTLDDYNLFRSVLCSNNSKSLLTMTNDSYYDKDVYKNNCYDDNCDDYGYYTETTLSNTTTANNFGNSGGSSHGNSGNFTPLGKSCGSGKSSNSSNSNQTTPRDTSNSYSNSNPDSISKKSSSNKLTKYGNSTPSSTKSSTNKKKKNEKMTTLKVLEGNTFIKVQLFDGNRIPIGTWQANPVSYIVYNTCLLLDYVGIVGNEECYLDGNLIQRDKKLYKFKYTSKSVLRLVSY